MAMVGRQWCAHPDQDTPSKGPTERRVGSWGGGPWREGGGRRVLLALAIEAAAIEKRVREWKVEA